VLRLTWITVVHQNEAIACFFIKIIQLATTIILSFKTELYLIMWRFIFFLVFLFACFIIFINKCQSDKPASAINADSVAVVNGSTERDPYEMMHVAFEGMPDETRIKALVEGVMDKYNLPKTNETARKIGSLALDLRKKSVVGFTEMELLTHIFQHGSTTLTFPQQAALSSVVLDKSKKQ
jgi:hypothetical protein